MTKHILIVDDDPAIVQLIGRALTGYDVRLARNGREALAVADDLTNCDLLITDYVMPSMPGDELAGRLRERWPALRTVLMTGYAAALSHDQLAVDACLAKPPHLSTLRQTVRTLIGPAAMTAPVNMETL
jgi:CheY-like chemotaxis protein